MHDKNISISYAFDIDPKTLGNKLSAISFQSKYKEKRWVEAGQHWSITHT